MTSTENKRGFVKCCVVGDGAVGKTCLLMAFATGAFNKEYIPTVYDNYRTAINVEGHAVELHLWDTAGQDDYNRIRPLSYPETHVFLVCFSLVDSISYENVKTKWYPEMLHFSKEVPRILVGCKLDLRESNGTSEPNSKRCVHENEGEVLKNNIKAQKYVECSALTRQNVVKLFEEVARTGMRYQESPKKKRRSCVVL